ncbi:MAG TPA: hypothetical protein VNZ45_14175 [Bacteroidia bacterium]|jgi:hypothetical protein|nr:hypothetical protein [Bacteroidia bacterium]
MKIVTIFLLSLITTLSAAQDIKPEPDTVAPFTIPSIINESNFAPTSITTINVNPTESKTSFKIGLIDPYQKKIKHLSMSFSADFKAINGFTTLYSTNSNTPLTYTFNPGFYCLLNPMHIKTSNRICGKKDTIGYFKIWFGITGTLQRNSYNLFSNTPKGDILVNTANPQEGNVMVQLNFFNTFNNTHFKNFVFSLSGGHIWTDNYTSLQQRTLQVIDSTIKPTATKQVVKTTSGVLGQLILYQGWIIKFEAYYSLYYGKMLNLLLGGGMSTIEVENPTQSTQFFQGRFLGLYFDLKKSTSISLVFQWNQTLLLESPTTFLSEGRNYGISIQGNIPITALTIKSPKKKQTIPLSSSQSK